MLEIIKVILETISKSLSIDAIRKAKKEKQLTEIGTEVFLLYSSLNSIIVVARHIVAVLERGLVWMNRKIKEGQPDREYWTELPLLLLQQELNLLQFILTIKRLGLKLEIIAPEAYRKLHPLIHGKLNAVNLLLGVMSVRSSAPKLVTMSEIKLRELMESSNSDIRDISLRFMRAEKDPFDGLLSVLPIDDISSIPIKNHKIIEDYLRARTPASVIAELEEIAGMIREAIEANFSLQDILLSVGDERSALGGDFIGF